jgi:hypothetical protein
MNKLKPLILAGFLALILTTSCKKTIEKKVQDMVMNAITSGEWIVEQYKEGDNNLSNHSFKFNSNGTLIGAINGTATEGTWQPNTTDFTIFTDFPTAGDPIKKLNGLWKIKDSDWDYVKADMQTDNGTKLLVLRKK